MNNIISRLKEPSSWSAIGGLLALLGVNLPPDLIQSVVYLGSAVAGVAGFAMKEKGRP